MGSAVSSRVGRVVQGSHIAPPVQASGARCVAGGRGAPVSRSLSMDLSTCVASLGGSMDRAGLQAMSGRRREDLGRLWGRS